MKPFEHVGLTFESIDELKTAHIAVQACHDTLEERPTDIADHDEFVSSLDKIATVLGGVLEIEELAPSVDPDSKINHFPELSVAEYIMMALRVARETHPNEEVRHKAKAMLVSYDDATMFESMLAADDDQDYDGPESS